MSKTHTVRLTSDDIFTISDALNRRRQELQALIDLNQYPVDSERVWREAIKGLDAVRDELLLVVSAHDASVAERAARKLLAA